MEMSPICVAYHCLLYQGNPPELMPTAYDIVSEQMDQLRESTLLDVCSEMIVGCNGGKESDEMVQMLFPSKAKVLMHGLESKSENLTIVALCEWCKTHPDWFVLYFHSKGATYPHGSMYANLVSKPWRDAMMVDLVDNWPACVLYLRNHDIVCSTWKWNMCDGTQHIPAGNFLWMRSDFAASLPSMYDRGRIQTSGIGAVESRHEAEVHWGNGRRPRVMQYRPEWKPWLLQRKVAA